MGCFKYPWDTFYVSIWETAIWQCLERGDWFKRTLKVTEWTLTTNGEQLRSCQSQFWSGEKNISIKKKPLLRLSALYFMGKMLSSFDQNGYVAAI